MHERDQPDAGERRQQEPCEPRPRMLAEHEPGARDGDEGLRLLQHQHRDEVAVEERLREEDRRDRRRSCADRDARDHVTRAGTPQRNQRAIVDTETEAGQDRDR